MRALTLPLAAAAIVYAGGASAAPAQVSVVLGPELQSEAKKTYGVDEVGRLADRLRLDVENALTRTGALTDTRVELVLVDAKPNRPTFKQLGDTTGLSMRSFGVGGAEIGGRVIAADGTVTPLGYRWYETDIRRAHASWVWQDAEWTFDRFAHRLARGQTYAQR